MVSLCPVLVFVAHVRIIVFRVIVFIFSGAKYDLSLGLVLVGMSDSRVQSLERAQLLLRPCDELASSVHVLNKLSSKF